MSAVVVNLNPLVCLLSLFLCGFSVGAKLAKGVKNYLALCQCFCGPLDCPASYPVSWDSLQPIL